MLPGSWAEVRARLSLAFGGGPGADAIAAEWLREALLAAWGGVEHEGDLPSIRRGLALQKASGALLAVEEAGELSLLVGVRAVVAECFARYCGGVRLEGPPWRLDPYEERPTWEQWVASADFD